MSAALNVSTSPFEGHMTDKQLAAYPGCHPKTLQRERALKLGPPYIKFGRKILYKKETIQLWLASKEHV